MRDNPYRRSLLEAKVALLCYASVGAGLLLISLLLPADTSPGQSLPWLRTFCLFSGVFSLVLGFIFFPGSMAVHEAQIVNYEIAKSMVEAGQYTLRWSYEQEQQVDQVNKYVLQQKIEFMGKLIQSPLLIIPIVVVVVILGLSMVKGSQEDNMVIVNGFLSALFTFLLYGLSILLARFVFRQREQGGQADVYWGEGFVLFGEGGAFWGNSFSPYRTLEDVVVVRGECLILEVYTRGMTKPTNALERKYPHTHYLLLSEKEAELASEQGWRTVELPES